MSHAEIHSYTFKFIPSLTCTEYVNWVECIMVIFTVETGLTSLGFTSTLFADYTLDYNQESQFYGV